MSFVIYQIKLIMKTFFAMLMGLMVSLSMVSCFGSDDDSHNDDDDGGSTSQVIVEGTWKVTFFEEDESNQTGHFDNYEFNFNQDHSLTASNGDVTQTGSWSTGTDDSTNKLIIQFSAENGPFEEISEDWQIIAKTSTKIELKHVSGGDGSIDYLTFEKL